MRFRPRVLALLLLAACGDDEFNGLPDGPVAPDTPEPDGPAAGLVKLTVTDVGLPRMGVKVYFQNADSSLVSATMTDVNGVASAVMEAGGFVTAIDPFPPRLPQGLVTNQLETFAGVKPLDELVLARNPPPADNTSINATVLLDFDPNAGFASYFLFAPCIPGGVTVGSGIAGSGSVGGALTFTGCGTMTDLTLVTVGSPSGVLSSIHLPNVPLTEGTTIDFRNIAYTAAENATWEFTNAPAFAASLDFVDVLSTARGPQSIILGSGVFDNGTSTTGFTRPSIAGTSQIVLADFSGAPNSRHTVLEWGPSTTAYSKSLADVLLASYSAAPSYDLATKTVTWTADPGAAPDLAIVRTDLARDAANPLSWSWEVAAPMGTELAVRYPVLPAPDDQFNPITNDGTTVSQLSTAKVPGGYDAIREHVLAISNEPVTGVPFELVVGATGRVVFQDLSLPIPAKPTRPLLPSAATIQKSIKAHRR